MMQSWEYKVVPAPVKGTKIKGAKTGEQRFAVSVEQILNEMAANGWQYVRAEMLPSTERHGLTGTSIQWRNLLIFKRPTGDDTHNNATPVVQDSAIDMPDQNETLEEEPDETWVYGDAETSDEAEARAEIDDQSDKSSDKA